MYSILVKENNILTITNKERIMQRSKLFDTLQFVVEPIYKGYNMAQCTVLLEYILPISKKYCTDILTLSTEKYNDYLIYTIPFDTNLTSESGKIDIQLTFILVDMDDTGKAIQRVRKTSHVTIDIIPIMAWSNIIPDDALSSLDQRIIKIDSQIKAVNDMNTTLVDTKADNIKYDAETNALQLLAGNREIGDKVCIYDIIKNGVPIVDFDNKDEIEKPSGNENNIVEF